MFGAPGKKSGLMLRTGQFLFAGASMGIMASTPGSYYSSAFRLLIAVMGFLCVWSFSLACYDLRAMQLNFTDEENRTALAISVIGDWVTVSLSLSNLIKFWCAQIPLSLLVFSSQAIASFSLGAVCSSSGAVALLCIDTKLCSLSPHLSCGKLRISVFLASIAWLLLSISSYNTSRLASRAARAF